MVLSHMRYNTPPLQGPFELGTTGRWSALIEGLLGAWWTYHTGESCGFRLPPLPLQRSLLERVALRGTAASSYAEADMATRMAIDMAMASQSLRPPNEEDWFMLFRR